MGSPCVASPEGQGGPPCPCWARLRPTAVVLGTRGSRVVGEHADDTVPYGVLTGDALFIGDIGRPDLLASIGVAADELGRMLYDSVQHKLMALPDAVRVFPAHGAGSACGKNLSTQRQSTIGQQRAANYACRPMGEERLVELVTAGQSAAPAYLVYDAILNRKEHGLFDPVALPRPLSVAEFMDRRAAGGVVVDARSPQGFAAGHVRGSVNVPRPAAPPRRGRRPNLSLRRPRRPGRTGPRRGRTAQSARPRRRHHGLGERRRPAHPGPRTLGPGAPGAPSPEASS